MAGDENRIDELAARLDRIERTTIMRRELLELEHFERSVVVDKRQKKLAQERRDAAKPRRMELFEQFKASRLIVSLGGRMTAGHLQLAYNEFVNELEPKPNRDERLHPHELIEVVASLGGITTGIVRNRVGTRVAGFEGAAIADKYRNDGDASGDSTLLRRAEKQRLSMSETS